MSAIDFRNVTMIYPNGTEALKNVDLAVADHEFLVLLGPSGCGKSTMLRLVAGLERPAEGDILFDGAVVNKLEPMARNVAMVFQNYALYPHMNVFKNIAFPLKSMKLPQEEIERRVEEAAKILDIEYLLNRKPKVLSGGQRQRVALGRAMVREPVVFLLDEPLSNLDVKMRTELREQIVSLHRRLKTTFIYVTHDQAEAMQLGDRLAIMDTGKIVQTGTPQEIYNYPNSVYVAGFVGAPKMNFFASLLRETEKGWAIKLMGQEIVIPEGRLAKRDPALQAGKKVIVGVRPEEFRIEANGDAEDFETIEATLDRIVPMGPEMHAEAVCGKQRFLIVFANRANVQSGDVVKLHVNRWSVHVFDAETEKNLCRPVFKEMGR